MHFCKTTRHGSSSCPKSHRRAILGENLDEFWWRSSAAFFRGECLGCFYGFAVEAKRQWRLPTDKQCGILLLKRWSASRPSMQLLCATEKCSFLSLASSARPSSSRNAVSSFSSLESLSWGGMKAGHNSTWDNPEKGKKDEKTLKLLRKERVWNILCIDCDREKTAFFGSAKQLHGRPGCTSSF